MKFKIFSSFFKWHPLSGIRVKCNRLGLLDVSTMPFHVIILGSLIFTNRLNRLQAPKGWKHVCLVHHCISCIYHTQCLTYNRCFKNRFWIHMKLNSHLNSNCIIFGFILLLLIRFFIMLKPVFTAPSTVFHFHTIFLEFKMTACSRF